MEKKSAPEKLILENLNKRKMTYTLILVLIIFSGFLLFNQLSGVVTYIKNTGHKEKKENVIYFYILNTYSFKFLEGFN